MEVKLHNLNGVEDAICSIFVSKGHLTPHKEETIRTLVAKKKAGERLAIDESIDLDDMYNKMLRIGSKHTTVIRFIDFSFTVRGLHRAAQDDFDAHSHRLNNRIIRSSTRICDFEGDAKSDYYKDKILTLCEVLEIVGVILPETVTDANGKVYKRGINGYISEEALANEPNQWDIQRGLYHLAIPSNFIAKCDLFEFAHIYKMRNKDTFAHPELREMIESLTDQLADALGLNHDVMRDYLMKIPN